MHLRLPLRLLLRRPRPAWRRPRPLELVVRVRAADKAREQLALVRELRPLQPALAAVRQHLRRLQPPACLGASSWWPTEAQISAGVDALFAVLARRNLRKRKSLP